VGKIFSKNTKFFKQCCILNALKAEVHINFFLPHRKQCHYYKDHTVKTVERNNGVYCENLLKHINILCGQSAAFNL
jgi:hypothetical protein